MLFTVALSIVTGILFGSDPCARRVARRPERRHQGLEQPFGQRLPPEQDALGARARRGQPRRRAARRRVAVDPHVARARTRRSRATRPRTCSSMRTSLTGQRFQNAAAVDETARLALERISSNSGRRRRVDDVLRAAAGRLRLAVQHRRPRERGPFTGGAGGIHMRRRPGYFDTFEIPVDSRPRVQRDGHGLEHRPS